MTATSDTPAVVDLHGVKTVHLDLDAFGVGVVELDGVDIARTLRRVHYSSPAERGEVSQVVLEVIPRRGIEFTGGAHVVIGEPPALGAAAAEFLAAIDPEELEKAALARPDLGHEPHAMTRAMLDQLIEWARGGA